MVFYTSGTTADPKGAHHTDSTLAAAALAMVEGYRLTDTDRSAIDFPIAHVAGPTWLLAALSTGCTLLPAESFDLDLVVPQLARQGVTIAGAAAAFVLGFLDYQQRQPGRPLFPPGPSLHVRSGTKADRPPCTDQGRAGAPLLSAYGCTECPILAIASPDDDDEALATSEGALARGVEAKVVGTDGRPVPDGTEGELLVRAPQLFLGYLDPELNHEGFSADGDRTGTWSASMPPGTSASPDGPRTSSSAMARTSAPGRWKRS